MERIAAPVARTTASPAESPRTVPRRVACTTGRVLAAVALALCAASPARARGEELVPQEHLPAFIGGIAVEPVWRFDLKRYMTDRGSIDERTKTVARIEKLLDAPIGDLRLDVPFVDKNNSFRSDPSNAGLGDLEGRIGLRPLAWGSSSVVFLFTDATFPTAATTSLGAGKWQLGPAAALAIEVPTPWRAPTPGLSFQPQVQQYFSIAGSPDRADINYTSFEAKLELEWPGFALVNVNPKPVVDWTSGIQTACVLDVQAIWLISRRWRASLRAGTRLWGPTLPATYDSQLELSVRLTL